MGRHNARTTRPSHTTLRLLGNFFVMERDTIATSQQLRLATTSHTARPTTVLYIHNSHSDGAVKDIKMHRAAALRPIEGISHSLLHSSHLGDL